MMTIFHFLGKLDNIKLLEAAGDITFQNQVAIFKLMFIKLESVKSFLHGDIVIRVVRNSCYNETIKKC